LRLKSTIIVAGVAALVAVVATTVAIMVLAFPASINSPPNVKFVEFTFDRKQDIKVGESLKVFFNVVNHESRTFNDVRVGVFIEPSSSYQPYLLIDKPTVILPALTGKDSQTGQNQVTISVTGSPAKEAIYTVRGVIYVDGMQTDVREFDLKIRQQ
jgi:hypothetical protein